MSFASSLSCLYGEVEVCHSSLHHAEKFLYFEFPGIIFASLEIVMVVLFWIVNPYVDSDDFTKAYVTVLMVPLSTTTVMKMWTVANNVAEAPAIQDTYSDISQFIDNMYGALTTGSQLYILIGMVGFVLLLIVTMVQQRRIHEKEDAWVGFCTIQFITLSLGILNYFLDLPYHGLPQFAVTLTTCLSSIVLIIFGILSVLSLVFMRRKSLSNDPLVREAKERLFLAITAAALVLPTCWYSLLFYLTTETTADDAAHAEWILRIVQFITAPVVIPSLFVLKPYHIAFFAFLKSRKKNNRSKATPLMETKEEQAPATRLSYPPQLIYPPATPSQLSGAAAEA